jgi:hypothetical protein
MKIKNAKINSRDSFNPTKDKDMKDSKNREEGSKFASSEEMDRLMNDTWNDYIKVITEKGYDSPKRVPSSETTNQHCGV